MAAMGAFAITIAASYGDIIFWPDGRWFVSFLAVSLAAGLIFKTTDSRYDYAVEWHCWKSLGLTWWHKPEKEDFIESTTRYALAIYTTSTLVIALFKRVSNGDAQIYNLARIPSMLITRSPFLEEHSSSKQAFSDLFHDIIYTIDISVGNFRGLGSTSWVENVLILSMISWIAFYGSKQTYQSREPCSIITAHPKRVVCFTQLVYMAMPMSLFQSTSVKNDLCVVLFSIVSFCSLLVLSHHNERKPLWSRSELTTVISISMLSLFLGIGSKSYAILCIPALASIGLLCSRDFYINLKSSIYLPAKHGMPSISRIASSTVVIISILCSTVVYLRHLFNIQLNWSNEKSLEVAQHLTPMQRGELFNTATLLNPMKVLLEFFVQAPLPFHVKPSLNGNVIGNEGPYTFGFGGYFGEDTAWPGTFFFLVLAAALFTFITDRVKAGLLRQLNAFDYSFIYGCLIFIWLTLVVYWQPWYSRFIGFGVVPMVPYVGYFLYRITTKIQFRKRAFAFTLCLLLLPSSLALGKTVATSIYSELIDKDHYIKLSYSMTHSEIVDSLNLEKDAFYDICIARDRSPSFYPLLHLAMSKIKGNNSIRFLSSQECEKKLSQPLPDKTLNAGSVFIFIRSSTTVE